MFLVSQSLDSCAGEIRSWLDENPSVAIVVAASYFEWIVSRAVLSLSQRPNAEIRQDLIRVYGLEKYKTLWWKELQHAPNARRLTEVVSNWHAVTQSFEARNILVHGRDRYTRNMASPKVESLLAAAKDIHVYVARQGINLNGRLRVRRGKRPAIGDSGSIQQGIA